MLTAKHARVIREIEKRLDAGIEAAVRRAAEGYEKRVTQEESPPASTPGEFPHVVTGQGAANIAWGVERGIEGEVEGRFGVMGEDSPIPAYTGHEKAGGEHLDVLREEMGRLGMDTSLYEDIEAVRRAFRRGAK